MQLLAPPEVADILGIKVSTLTQGRWAGRGPSWHRLGGGSGKGAIRYSLADLQAYITASRQAT